MCCRVRLVLPGVLVSFRLGAQVVDEQRGHQRVAGRRLEYLDAEPVRTRIGSGKGAVLQDRTGARGRSDVQRHQRAVVSGDGRPPALQPLGERVVGPLLCDQAVVDAGVRSRRVVAPQQPAAR